MLSVKISVPTRALHPEIRQGLHQAMEIGAQGVQFDLRYEVTAADYGESARRQLLHALKERSLEPASASFPLRGTLADPQQLDRRIAALKSAITLAAQLKLRRFLLACGPIPGSDTEEQAGERTTIVQILSDLAAQGNHEGVLLCLRPCGESGAALRSLAEEIRTGPVLIDADPAAWLLSGHSPQIQLRSVAEALGHVEFRDGLRGADGLGREVPVGRGEVDWDEMAALLGEMDYRGWLNVERTTGNDMPGDIARAVQYVKNLLPQE